MEIVLINPKIIGAHTMDEILYSIKRNLGVDFKHFFVVFRDIDGFAPLIKK